MTPTAQVMNATTISGVLALIGPAARSPHVLMERVTVIIIQSVKDHYCVAMTTVQLDLQGWIAVQTSSTPLSRMGFVRKALSVRRQSVRLLLVIWDFHISQWQMMDRMESLMTLPFATLKGAN